MLTIDDFGNRYGNEHYETPPRFKKLLQHLTDGSLAPSAATNKGGATAKTEPTRAPLAAAAVGHVPERRPLIGEEKDAKIATIICDLSMVSGGFIARFILKLQCRPLIRITTGRPILNRISGRFLYAVCFCTIAYR